MASTVFVQNASLQTIIATATPDLGTSYVYFFLTAIMSSLSIVGCLTIFVTYLLYKDLHSKGRQLLVFLSIADFLTAVGNFMGVIWVVTDRSLGMWYCTLHSSLTSFSSISSYLWNVSMAVFLFVSIVLQKNNILQKLLIAFHICCWIVPAIVTITALSMNVYGTDPGVEGPSWCWINGGRDDVMFWQFFTGKAWEIFAYICVTFFYGATVIYLLKQARHMKRALGDSSKEKGKKKPSAIDEANKRLIYVPLVFILLRIWGTVRFLTEQSWISYPQGFGDSGQGFSNAMIFCLFTKSVRHHIFPCFKNTPQEENQLPARSSQMPSKKNDVPTVSSHKIENEMQK